MKQCPNPNCILYTRLEELPDAYLKCPGCGGLLVDANNTTSGLGSGYTKLAPSASALHRQIHIREDATLGHSKQPQSVAYADDEEYAYEDEYAYDEDGEEESSAGPERRGLSTASKVVFGVGALMLLAACLLVGTVLSGRLFARSAVSPAQATETAVAAIRPAVYTPIPLLPTAQSSGAPFPTAAYTQPTLVPQQPPPTSRPTSIVAPPTSPPQQQTGGGVLGAQMVGGGGSSGSTATYKPNDVFHVIVRAAASVTAISVRLYAPDGTLLSTVRQTYALPQAYNASFDLKNAAPWPAGNYRVDVHTNDSAQPASSVPFTVAP